MCACLCILYILHASFSWFYHFLVRWWKIPGKSKSFPCLLKKLRDNIRKCSCKQWAFFNIPVVVLHKYNFYLSSSTIMHASLLISLVCQRYSFYESSDMCLWVAYCNFCSTITRSGGCLYCDGYRKNKTLVERKACTVDTRFVNRVFPLYTKLALLAFLYCLNWKIN